MSPSTPDGPTVAKGPWSSFGKLQDNTEGIAAFDDIDFPRTAKVIADFGGGSSDAAGRFMKQKYENIVHFVVIDPFLRTPDHNAAAHGVICDAHGADCVTAMSVLNVIPTADSRASLITDMHTALKPGGTAYFKVWPGTCLELDHVPTDPAPRPARGTVDRGWGVYQANALASSFHDEVATVFGDSVIATKKVAEA